MALSLCQSTKSEVAEKVTENVLHFRQIFSSLRMRQHYYTLNLKDISKYCSRFTTIHGVSTKNLPTFDFLLYLLGNDQMHKHFSRHN